MKYSVILPVKNGGQYIKECIDSILSQSYTDFNLIILDNCSTDGTLEWLLTLKDSRLNVIPSAMPLSIEENWARVCKVKKNEFITLIGHDDLLYPRFLENIDRLTAAYPRAGLYHAHFQFIDAKGKLVRNCKAMPSFFTGTELLRGFLTQSVDSMGTGYVMRAADYDALGGIPVKYPNLLFADFELWLSLSQKGGMAVASDTAFAFRVHKSTTGISQDFKFHKALGIYVDYLAALMNGSPKMEAIIKKEGSNLLLFYCTAFSHRLLRSPIEERGGITVNAFIRETQSMAKKLRVADQYSPDASVPIRLAKLIDSNQAYRKLFLLFKKLYPKPIR